MTDISVLRFYGYIEYIRDISMDILTQTVDQKVINSHGNVKKKKTSQIYLQKYNKYFKVVLLKKLIYVYMISDIKFNDFMSIDKKCKFYKCTLIITLDERFYFIKDLNYY